MKKIETLDIKKTKTISHTKTKRNKIKKNANHGANGKNTNQKLKWRTRKKNVRNLKIYTPQITQWINSYVHAINYINRKKSMFTNSSWLQESWLARKTCSLV